MAETNFPTEVVSLPSKGLLYPKESPLSAGGIEIKYMTAKEEDILTSANLIKKGVVIDKLLESLIVNKDIKVDDLLVGDKNAILIAARILAYGKDYEVTHDGEKVIVDLAQLKDKVLNEKDVKNGNIFHMELPATKRKLTFKLLTSKDEKEIDKEVESLTKISDGVSYNLTTRFKHQILSVDENPDKAYIRNFVDNEFLTRDSLEFRKHIDSITPDVDMNWEYTNKDGERRQFTVPMTVSFLWPSVRV
tara:strand:+ start:857 stop:1600 length:744 start_codon:yes stop_codon:yes gene_type:complete